MAIYKLLMKILTPAFDVLTPISSQCTIFRWF